jgi:hypothetical protein
MISFTKPKRGVSTPYTFDGPITVNGGEGGGSTTFGGSSTTIALTTTGAGGNALLGETCVNQWGGADSTSILFNAAPNYAGGYKYLATGPANAMTATAGGWNWVSWQSGTAGGTLPGLVDQMDLSAAGDLTVKLSVKLASTQTILNGAISGNAVFSEPFQGSSYKKAIIYCNALVGATATYTFPAAFTNTPQVVPTASGPAASVVSTLTTTGCVVTGTTTTGPIIIEGY